MVAMSMLGPLCTAEVVDDYCFSCQVLCEALVIRNAKVQRVLTGSNLVSAQKLSGGFGYVRENTHHFFWPQVVDFSCTTTCCLSQNWQQSSSVGTNLETNDDLMRIFEQSKNCLSTWIGLLGSGPQLPFDTAKLIGWSSVPGLE